MLVYSSKIHQTAISNIYRLSIVGKNDIIENMFSSDIQDTFKCSMPCVEYKDKYGTIPILNYSVKEFEISHDLLRALCVRNIESKVSY